MYIELGKFMRKQTRVQDEPFKDFLNIGGGDFEGPNGYIQKFFGIIDHEAESATPREQEQAKQTFLKSCLLEWYFWDAAYKQITWDNWKAVALDGKGAPML